MPHIYIYIYIYIYMCIYIHIYTHTDTHTIICSSIHWWTLGSFYLLTIVNNPAINMDIYVYNLPAFSFWGVYPGV